MSLITGPFVYAPTTVVPPASSSSGSSSGGSSTIDVSEFEMPFLYGEREVPLHYIPLSNSGDDLYGILVATEGPVNLFKNIKLGNGNLYVDGTGIINSNIVGGLTLKYGTSDQTASSLLTDRLPGTAYAAITLKMHNMAAVGSPDFTAVMQGYKLYDPRLDTTNGGTGTHRLADITTWAYSNNPALCLAHFLMNKRVGPGISSALIDWVSVAAAADYCDSLVGSEKRYEFNYLFTGGMSVQDVIDRILIHFLGHLSYDGVFHFEYAYPKSLVGITTFTDQEPDRIWNTSFSRPQRQDRYKKVVGTWTNPTTWEQVPYQLEAPDVAGMQNAVAQQSYDLSGFTKISQCHRVVLFLLNSRLADLDVTFQAVNDKGILPGGLCKVTDDIGLSAKLIECVTVEPQADGSTVISGREYDPAVFSDAIVTEPTFPDTDLPGPDDAPENPTDIQLTEMVDHSAPLQRLRINWTASTSPFISHYEFRKVQNIAEEYVYTDIGRTKGGECFFEWATTDPLDLEFLEIDIRAVSIFGIPNSTWTAAMAGGSVWSGFTQGAAVWKAGAAITAKNGKNIVLLSWAYSGGANGNPAYATGAIEGTNLFTIYRGPVVGDPDTIIATKITGFSIADRPPASGTYRYYLEVCNRFYSPAGTLKTVDVAYQDISVNRIPIGAGSDGLTDSASLTYDDTTKVLTIDGKEAVTGPAAATDNALARFDGTTGRLLQDSGVLVDDSGNVAIGNAIVTTVRARIANSTAPAAGVSPMGLHASNTITAAQADNAPQNYIITSFSTTGTQNAIYGLVARAANTSTGTVTTAIALYSQVQNNSTGTITTAYGLYLAGPSNASGTITTSYGVYQIDPASINLFSGAILHNGTKGIGYAAGAGGTVTQGTNKATGVTLSKLCGTITMHNAALAAGAIVSFTVTNTLMAAGDVVHLQHDSGGTLGAYTVNPSGSAAGSFTINVRNNTAGSLSEALVLRFVIIKAVAA